MTDPAPSSPHSAKPVFISAHELDAEGEREALQARMDADAELRDHVVSQAYMHGLLAAEAERGSLTNARRIQQVMQRIRARKVRGMLGRAAGVLLVGGLALLSWTEFQSPEGGGGGTQADGRTQNPAIQPVSLVEVQGPFVQISGGVSTHAISPQRYRVASLGDAPSTLRLNRSGTLVLSQGAVVELDDAAGVLSVAQGEVGVESEQVWLDFGGSRARLEGGIAVVEHGEEGVAAQVFRGALTPDQLEAPRAERGQVLKLLHQEWIAENSPASQLPAWVAQGRSEELIDEIQSVLGDEVAFDRAAWLTVIEPMLSQPIGRELLLEMIRGFDEADFSAEDWHDLLAMTNQSLQAQMKRAQEKNFDVEAHITKQLNFMSSVWAAQSPEEREKLRERMREMARKRAESFRDRDERESEDSDEAQEASE